MIHLMMRVLVLSKRFLEKSVAKRGEVLGKSVAKRGEVLGKSAKKEGKIREKSGKFQYPPKMHLKIPLDIYIFIYPYIHQ